MKKTISLALLAGLVTLAACNTIEGVGEDVQSGGAAISDGANSVKEEL